MTAGVLPASVSPPNAFRPLLRLALPIIGVNVGMMLMGVVDTVMVGRLSPQALAAVALGNLYGMAVLMFGLGILLSLDPVLSQAHGAGEDETVALGVQRGVVLAILLSVPLAAVMWFAEPFLRMVRQPADVVPLAGTYCRVLIPGVLPFLLFTVGRQTMQVLHRVQPVLWTILIANLVNIGLNYWLIFGGAGVPPLGVAGSAAATAVSRVVMIVLLVFLARRELGPMLRPIRPRLLQAAPFATMLRIGVPIALQVEIEMAAFSIVGLLMGMFGTVQVAGHQIALNLASLTFMVPMGVGMAASVLIGQAVGRGDRGALRAGARAALVVGAGFMVLTGLIFLVVPHWIAALYTNAEPVVAFAAVLLPIAGIFQVFDGIQVVCIGVLRGLGDTHTPMLVNLVGFGMLGLATSTWLAYRTSLGPIGLWWGLVVGLAAVALILLHRVRAALRRPLQRI
ncbi:MAG: MATE family efflux transporter [Gemmatimonadales bacterium]|nr:MATE family efflux transporter [Gemmatimonadales bacterium]